jgi:hypothetical protein
MWRVSALGRNNGLEYVYLVSAPADTHRIDVVDEAYYTHGKLHAAGVVTDWLGHDYTVEWTDEL